MPTWETMTGNAGGVVRSTQASRYHGFTLARAGAGSFEVDGQIPVRDSYTWSHLGMRVISNASTANWTVRSRINGAFGDQTITFGASVTGVVLDTTNSDSLTNGNLINCHSNGTTTGDVTFTILETQMTHATETKPLVYASGGAIHSGTSFTMIVGDPDQNSNEADVQYKYRAACTLSGLRVYCAINTHNGEGHSSTRIDGVDGNQTVTHPASTTGAVEDTTNSDAIAVGELVNYKTVTDGSSGDFRPQSFGMTQTGGGIIYEVGDAESDSLSGSVFFALVDDWNTTTTTESHVQKVARLAYTAQNMRVIVDSHSATNGMDYILRRNGANSALSVAVAESTTGAFENTSDTVAVSVDDLVNWSAVHGGGGGISRATLMTFETATGTAEPNITAPIAAVAVESPAPTLETDQPASSAEISFISSTQSANNTGTLTGLTRATGDIIVAEARRNTSITAPAVATNWTPILTQGSEGDLGASVTVAYYIVDGNEVNPTFSNANSVILKVYRGQHPTTPIGASASAGATATVPALTFTVTNGSSWAIIHGGDNAWTTPTLSGAVLRELVGARNTGWDTDGGVTGWSATAISGGSGARRVVAVFELVAAEVSATEQDITAPTGEVVVETDAQALVTERAVRAAPAAAVVEAPAPVLSVEQSLTAPTANAVVEPTAPSLAIELATTAPTASTVIEAPAPTLAVEQATIALTAVAVVEAPAPTLELATPAQNITAPVADAVIEVPAPTLAIELALLAPTSDTVIEGEAPQLVVEQALTAPTAAAAVEAPDPSLEVFEPAQSLEAPTAESVIDAPAPTLTIESSLVAPTAEAVVEGVVPQSVVEQSLTAPAGDAVVEAPAPTLEVFVPALSLEAPAADTVAEAPAPTFITGLALLAPVAAAVVEGPVPAFALEQTVLAPTPAAVIEAAPALRIVAVWLAPIAEAIFEAPVPQFAFVHAEVWGSVEVRDRALYGMELADATIGQVEATDK